MNRDVKPSTSTKDKDERPMLNDRPLKQSKLRNLASSTPNPTTTVSPASVWTARAPEHEIIPNSHSSESKFMSDVAPPTSDSKSLYDDDEEEEDDGLPGMILPLEHWQTTTSSASEKLRDMPTLITIDQCRKPPQIQGRIFLVGDPHEMSFLPFATVLETQIFNPNYLVDGNTRSKEEEISAASHGAALARHFSGEPYRVLENVLRHGKTRPRVFFGADPVTVFSPAAPEAIDRAYHVVTVPEHSFNYLRNVAHVDFDADFFSLSGSFLDPEDDVPFRCQPEKGTAQRRFKAEETLFTMNKSYDERSRYFLFQSRVSPEERLKNAMKERQRESKGTKIVSQKLKKASGAKSATRSSKSPVTPKDVPAPKSPAEIALDDGVSEIDQLVLAMEQMNYDDAESVLKHGKFLASYDPEWWTHPEKLYVHSRDYSEDYAKFAVPDTVKYMFVPAGKHGWWKTPSLE